MSSEVIKEFLVGLGFKVDDAGLAKFSEGIVSASIRVTALATAVTAAAAGVVASVRHIADEYDQLEKLASQFRTTADAVDEFVDTAKVLGVGDEKSIESLKNLDRAIVDTSMGMGRAKLVFEDLGIKVTDVAGKLKPTTEVMSELAEKFKDMERGKQLRVMERLGLDPALLKVFNGDLAAISAELQEIDNAANFDFETAIVESKAFMQTWRQMQREIEKWKMLFSKAFESVTVKLMPKFRAQIKSITDSMVAFRKTVMENMPKAIEAIMPIVDVIMRVAEAFIKIVARIASGAMAIIGWFMKLNETTDGWAGYILAAAAAWKYLNLSFLATPIGMILSLAAAIALLVDDFLTWKEGGDSLIDWAAWEPAIDAAMGAITALRDLLANAFTAIFAAVDALVKLLTGDFAGAWAAVGEYVNSVIGIFTSAWDVIKGVGSAIGNFAGAVASIFGRDGASAPASAPSPQAQAAVSRANQNVNQQTQIVVQGAGNPDATAKAVAGQQSRVNADMARNMRGAAR